MIEGHDQIRRAVTNLPNGIRTVTPIRRSTGGTDDQDSRREHGNGWKRVVSSICSSDASVLFETRTRIKTKVRTTEKGQRHPDLR